MKKSMHVRLPEAIKQEMDVILKIEQTTWVEFITAICKEKIAKFKINKFFRRKNKGE